MPATKKKERDRIADFAIAMGHPTRRAILRELARVGEGNGMASPNELSKMLDEGLSQISYHVRVLRDCDAVVLQKTVPRRGAVEHYYRRAKWMQRRMEDSAALDKIADYLSEKGPYPDVDDGATIAEIVRATGREW